MNRLAVKWKRLPAIQRGLLAVAALLAVLVLFRYTGFRLGLLFPGARIEQKEEEISAMARRLAVLEREQLDWSGRMNVLKRDLRPFFWNLGDQSPTSEIQAELNRIARTENITIRTMGSPRTNDVNEYIRSMEISLNILGNMREIGRFLAALERSDRRVYWVTCRIRPNNIREPEILNLTGQVRAYFLVPAAERAVFGQ